MFNFFKRKEPKKVVERGFYADEVRKYARTNFITPARQKGEKRVTFSATDLHEGLKYQERYPLVCSAIDAAKFLVFAKVKLIKRTGPKQSSTVKWTFEV